MTKWSDLLEKSICLAVNAHQGQRQKDGSPYILHPLHLMQQQTTPEAQIVAVLHDVVEDTDVTFDDLETLGLPTEVVEAVRLLTHDEGTSYPDYIRSIKSNPLARRVKMADLSHNMDIRRLPEMTANAKSRLGKYHNAWLELNDSDRTAMRDGS